MTSLRNLERSGRSVATKIRLSTPSPTGCGAIAPKAPLGAFGKRFIA
jgi:hypothetical protein